MGKLPSASLVRPRINCLLSHTTSTTSPRPSLPPSTASTPTSATQVRHATFVPRYRRPYEFTQLVQQSDGSTYTVRTTSPQALYRSTKDSRNHILWQPHDKSLRNVEVDEAGKLAAFRQRFGRSWDAQIAKDESAQVDAIDEANAAADAAAAAGAGEEGSSAEGAAQAADDVSSFDALEDLISGYAERAGMKSGTGLTAKEQMKRDRKKKK